MLLFSTMTRALDVVADYLDWRGFSHLRLDGATSAAERGELVARFNDPGKWPCPAPAAVRHRCMKGRGFGSKWGGRALLCSCYCTRSSFHRCSWRRVCLPAQHPRGRSGAEPAGRRHRHHVRHRWGQGLRWGWTLRRSLPSRLAQQSWQIRQLGPRARSAPYHLSSSAHLVLG